MHGKLRSNLCLIIPPFLTVIILLITYIVKGVYPFGSSNIAYYDVNQYLVSLYARNYEIMHGEDTLIFDWFLGAGMDMTDGFQEMTLHPVNWFLFFVKPDDVLNFLSWFLMIKLILTSLSISFFLKKSYDLSLPVHIALSMIYTFSGYTVQYYVCTSYLESMMLLPLLVLALRYMLDKGKGIPYMLAMTFQLITQPYLGFMTLLFVLFYSFGYMFTRKEKQERKILSSRIGIYTFLSIALSAAAVIPAVSKWATSNRIADYGSFDILDIFTAENNGFLEQKLFMTFNTEMAAAIFFIVLFNILIKRKKYPSDLYFHIYMFVVMMFPMINEGSLLLWHMGSYMHYPYRNGYMFVFAAIELICCMSEHQSEELPLELKTKAHRISVAAVTCLAAAVSLFMLIGMDLTFVDYGIHEDRGSYSNSMPLFMLSIAACILLVIFASKRVKEISFLSFSMVKILITAVCFIAPLKYSDTNIFMYYTTRDKFIGDTIDIRNNAGLKNDNLSRIKLLYPALSKNYPILLGMPSVNQWTNRAPALFYNEICLLGYANDFTSNLDCGGTLFSDAILNNKQLIVYSDPYVPEKLYSRTTQTGEYTVYDINYTLPFGMLCDDKILDTDCSGMNSSDHHKQIADAFSVNGESIFSVIPTSDAEAVIPAEEGYKYTYEYKLHADSPCVLYIESLYYSYITVNGKQLVLPYFDDLENTGYNVSINSIALAGCFDAEEDITVRISNSTGIKEYDRLLLLDLDAMDAICSEYTHSCASSYKAGKNRLDITADVNGRNYMFLPLEYYDGWKAKVNGSDAEIIPVMNGAFMALKLPDGHCDIVMTYMPKSIIRGAAISLAGAIALALIVILRKKGRDITENKVVYNAAYYIFSTVSAAALAVVYILPIII